MDWIEQLLGVSPDGGSGALEALYLVVLALGLVALARWGFARRRRGSSGGSERR
jgi:hypothetical protein